MLTVYKNFSKLNIRLDEHEYTNENNFNENQLEQYYDSDFRLNQIVQDSNDKRSNHLGQKKAVAQSTHRNDRSSSIVSVTRSTDYFSTITGTKKRSIIIKKPITSTTTTNNKHNNLDKHNNFFYRCKVFHL